MSDSAPTLVVESASLDETEWEQAPRGIRRESEAPVLSVEGFGGLLDWLLELVRTHRLDLSRLSIVALIEAFADALEQALQVGIAARAASSLSRWADWLVMAATLTQQRARLILPATAPKAQAAAREAEGLRRQLLSRQHIQAAADWLERRQQLGIHIWARGRAEAGVGSVASEGGDIAELMRACLAALALPDRMADAYRLPPRTLWPVPASIARIRDRLAALPDGSTLAAFLPDLEVGGARYVPGTIGLGQYACCQSGTRARRTANAESEGTVERHPGRAAKPHLGGADIAVKTAELQVEREAPVLVQYLWVARRAPTEPVSWLGTQAFK